MSLDHLKEHARAQADSGVARLVSLSHRIHDHPETAFEEVQASGWVAEELAAAGLEVTASVAGLPTALVASVGDGPLVVGVCAEYDALPGIGHACGHNVIAAAAVGVAVALGPLVDEIGITLKIFGTPAEERGGGKILMLQRGAFEGVHAAMMIHPAPVESVHFDALAWTEFDVKYVGKEAHASMYPEQGVNAADGLTVAQVAVGLLRQHLPAGHQVHGIVTDGGDAANIVPSHAGGHFMARAATLRELESELFPRVQHCFEAGAVATGAQLVLTRSGPSYSEFRSHELLSNAYADNAVALGRRFAPRTGRPAGGSTDMANVSLAISAIHPMMDIGSLPAVNHQADFAAAAATPTADAAIRDGALGMAWTIIDVATSAEKRASLIAGAPGARSDRAG